MKKGLLVLIAVLAVVTLISTGCSKKTSKLEKDLEQVKAEKQLAISEKASLEFVLAQTQDSLIETEKQLKTFTELLKKNNTENAATVKKLTDNLTFLQTNLDKANENIKLLKEDNEQLINSKSNATESLNNLKKQNQDLQNQIQELKKQLIDLSAKQTLLDDTQIVVTASETAVAKSDTTKTSSLKADIPVKSSSQCNTDNPLVKETDQKLGVTISVDYFNRYLFDGYDVYSDNDSAIQPAITLDLWDTNFSVMVWSSFAIDNGHKNSEEFDYAILYSNNAFSDSALQTDFTLCWTYFDYYDNGSKATDEQSLELILSWPNVCDKITPFYAPKKYWPASESGQTKGGWLHKFGFEYPFRADIPMLHADLNLTCDITYNDGYSSSDHDWSHSTILIETEPINISNGQLIPVVGYQISMDDSVNTDDEFILGAKYSISF